MIRKQPKKHFIDTSDSDFFDDDEVCDIFANCSAAFRRLDAELGLTSHEPFPSSPLEDLQSRTVWETSGLPQREIFLVNDSDYFDESRDFDIFANCSAAFAKLDAELESERNGLNKISPFNSFPPSKHREVEICRKQSTEANSSETSVCLKAGGVVSSESLFHSTEKSYHPLRATSASDDFQLRDISPERSASVVDPYWASKNQHKKKEFKRKNKAEPPTKKIQNFGKSMNLKNSIVKKTATHFVPIKPNRTNDIAEANQKTVAPIKLVKVDESHNEAIFKIQGENEAQDYSLPKISIDMLAPVIERLDEIESFVTPSNLHFEDMHIYKKIQPELQQSVIRSEANESRKSVLLSEKPSQAVLESRISKILGSDNQKSRKTRVELVSQSPIYCSEDEPPLKVQKSSEKEQEHEKLYADFRKQKTSKLPPDSRKGKSENVSDKSNESDEVHQQYSKNHEINSESQKRRRGAKENYMIKKVKYHESQPNAMKASPEARKRKESSDVTSSVTAGFFKAYKIPKRSKTAVEENIQVTEKPTEAENCRNMSTQNVNSKWVLPFGEIHPLFKKNRPTLPDELQGIRPIVSLRKNKKTTDLFRECTLKVTKVLNQRNLIKAPLRRDSGEPSRFENRIPHAQFKLPPHYQTVKIIKNHAKGPSKISVGPALRKGYNQKVPGLQAIDDGESMTKDCLALYVYCPHSPLGDENNLKSRMREIPSKARQILKHPYVEYLRAILKVRGQQHRLDVLLNHLMEKLRNDFKTLVEKIPEHCLDLRTIPKEPAPSSEMMIGHIPYQAQFQQYETRFQSAFSNLNYGAPPMHPNYWPSHWSSLEWQTSFNP